MKTLNIHIFSSSCRIYVKMKLMGNKKKTLREKIEDYIKLNADSDLAIHLDVLALCIFGVIMIGSATMGTTVGNFQALALTIAKQLLYVCVGYILMAKLSNSFSIRQLRENGFSYIVITLFIAMLACLAFPSVKGAKAWLRIPFPKFEMTIQPAEFAKIIVYLLVAAHLGDRKKNPKETWWDVVKKPFVLCGLIFAITLFLQKDFGTMTIQFLIFCIVFLIPKNTRLRPLQHILIGLFFVAVVAAIFILSPYGNGIIAHLPIATYQKNRLYSAIDPFKDKYGSGYQIVASLIAMSEGGWTGRGIGNSIRKYMNFPEANNDFILAIVIEELGFVGFLVLMALYAFLILRLLHYARRIHSETAKIILVGCAMYYGLHIFLNVGGVTGLIPMTGIPLPLISAGGSSAIAFLSSIGLCQAVIGAYKRKEIL